MRTLERFYLLVIERLLSTRALRPSTMTGKQHGKPQYRETILQAPRGCGLRTNLSNILVIGPSRVNLNPTACHTALVEPFLIQKYCWLCPPLFSMQRQK